MIDLNGEPIEVFSSKNYSLSDAIERMISRGKPLIVASDVAPTPSTVKKISAIFSSPVHKLGESLSTEEKKKKTEKEEAKAELRKIIEELKGKSGATEFVMQPTPN